MHPSPYYRFAGRPVTLIAVAIAVVAGGLFTADAAKLLAEALYWSDYQSAIKVITLYGPMYLLMLGTFSYLTTRYGMFARTNEYAHRSGADQIDFLYGTSTAPELLIMVPSYKEEVEVVGKTLISAGLVEYPKKRVVLLLDDPPVPTSVDDDRRLRSTRNLINQLNTLFGARAEKFGAEQRAYLERREGSDFDHAHEREHLGRLHGEMADWLEERGQKFLQENSGRALDRSDQFFLDSILLAPAKALRQRAAEMAELAPTLHATDTEYRRLATMFNTEFASFERKRYMNMSHAPNKAMNLNSYFSLLGRRFKEVQRPDGLYLDEADVEDATLVVRNADYIINLDADTLLLSEYAMRLVDIIERPGNERLAIVQTPYSAFPDAASQLERIAGATTDVQYLTHQGMTHFNATAWVGANALIRRRALDDIATECEERDFRFKVFIQDKTLIEDTAASIDLIQRNWRLYNYPARLAFSATPPDFGSLLIQRRRWANGGLLIFPNLIQYTLQRPLSMSQLAETLVRSNYLLGAAFTSVSMLILLVCSFNDNLFSIWVPLAALPYQLVYCIDLKIAGYRRRDLLRVYALNMMLIPIYLGGTMQSLRQAFTGRKAPFARTPKVAGRTATPLLYLFALYGLLAWCLFVFIGDLTSGRTFHMSFTLINTAAYLYGITRYVGLKASVLDFYADVKSFNLLPGTHMKRISAPRSGESEKVFETVVSRADRSHAQ
ncbi:MAG: glycosyl transferase [Xanthobacteraceae bacterium]|nr:MAG: glycosyl transferase [Xanthobacteraceae bacterium]